MTKHYLLRVCVKLDPPTVTKDDESRTVTLVGYYRNFGVTALSETMARLLVSQTVSDGEIVWTDYSYKEIDLDSFDKKITVHCKFPSWQGVWYQSGRVLFPANNDEDNNA